MNESKKVLVTGAAGAIGRIAVGALAAAGYAVRGLDRVAAPGLAEFHQGDLSDPEVVRAAVSGCDVVIHLGAVPDDADFLTELLPANVVGVYNILESARLAGVKRMLLASTGQVVWTPVMTGPWPVTIESPVQPRAWYAITKSMAETAGLVYARDHGMDVVAARLGSVPRNRAHAQEIQQDEIATDVYLGAADAARFFTRFVGIPAGFGFRRVYVCSRYRKQRRFDLEPTRELCGYEPSQTWPEGVDPAWLK